jgi:serine/threonine-protein phosphatase PP1 catalytic subunit
MCVEESGSEDRSVGGRNRLVQVVFWRCPLSQPSSNIDSKDGSSSGPKLSSYPSFGKSETKESIRSFRDSMRTKIPGGKSSDSPRASSTALSGDASSISLDKTDSQSIKSSTSGKSSQRHRASTSISESNGRRDSDEGDEDQEVPPSPTQSASVLAGHNDSQLEDAKRSGEVDAVSDVWATELGDGLLIHLHSYLLAGEIYRLLLVS